MHRSHRRIKVSSQDLSCSSPLLRSTANILDGWHGQRWYCISVNNMREREREREKESLPFQNHLVDHFHISSALNCRM